MFAVGKTILRGLHPPAQGCEHEQPWEGKVKAQPQRGFARASEMIHQIRHNPVGVEIIWEHFTQGGPDGAGQPWAEGQNPIGIYFLIMTL